MPEEVAVHSQRESSADAGAEDNGSQAPTHADDMRSWTGTGDNVSIAGSLPPAPSDSGAEEVEDDIWMANLSEQPTPIVGRRWSGRDPVEGSYVSNQSLREVEYTSDRVAPDAPASEFDEAPGDFFMDVAATEVQSPPESSASGTPAASVQDTAAVEDFTMISVGDLPSMRGHSSVFQPEEELGKKPA